MTTQQKILLVDDSAVNLEALTSFLEECKYTLLYATDGERALRIARAALPDLVLLDIIMPGIDGYETCKRMKVEASLARIPILFLSALEGVADKVKAFESGGVDYIAKPFQKEELIARVKTHLELYRIRRENERFASEMEALAQQRAKSLMHADRLATLGTLSAGVAHEINNPATFISVGIQSIERLWNSLSRAQQTGVHDEGVTALAMESMPQTIANIKAGVVRIQKIVNSLKTYAQAGSFQMEPCDLSRCIDDALLICHNRLKASITVEKDCGTVPTVLADSQRIEQVIINLILNASDVLEPRGGGTIRIGLRAQGAFALIFVEDNGPGISADDVHRIWDPFFTTKPRDKGTGLGLSVSKGIVEEHGGTIVAENRPSGGCRFTFTIPIREHPKS